MKKKIVIVSYSYPPSNVPAAQRPYAIAKYLDKSKFDVSVITCSNAESSLGKSETFDEKLQDVTLIKIKGWIGSTATALRANSLEKKKPTLKSKIKGSIVSILSSLVIPDRAIIWFPNVKKYLRRNSDFLKEIDVVITTSPAFTNHLIGRYIKSNNPKATWVADFRDFHYTGKSEEAKGFKGKIHQKLEQSVIKKSSLLVYVSSAMRKEYAAQYPIYASKMHVIYNGVDLEDFSSFNIKPLTSEKLSIFYAGSFYQGVRSPHPLFKLLDAAFERKLLKPEEVVVKIAGRMDPNEIGELNQYASSSCMQLLGLLPREEVLKEFTNASLLWLIVGDVLGHYSTVPLKLFEYMAARRPIVNFAPSVSEATTLINENSLGWNFDPAKESLEAQLKTFTIIIEKYRSGELHKPLDGNSLKNYTREKQTKAIEALVSI